MDNRPIGVMDSGLGGLSVMRILRQEMPHESLIFVGDQGHFPYGTKSGDQIRHYALSIGRFLVGQHIKLMVVACNTATAEALPLLQQELPVPVIGVVYPGALAAVSSARHQRIGVIATNATTRNGIYPRTIKQLDSTARVFSLAVQPLVQVVESRRTGTKYSQRLVNRLLSPLKSQNLDVLVMGCTHFPFLETEFRHLLGQKVRLVDPAEETVHQVQEHLQRTKQIAGANRRGHISLYSTGSAEHLTRGARAWLRNTALFGHHLVLH